MADNIKEESINNIPISKIISLFDLIYDEMSETNKNINMIKIDYETIGRKNNIPKELCDNLVWMINGFSIKIKYKEKIIIPCNYKNIEFVTNSEVYKVYTKEFVDNLIKKFLIENPLILANNIVYDYSKFEEIFKDEYVQSFKIIDEKPIDYKHYFDLKENETMLGIDYSRNFEYYFKYPNKNDKFHYNFSSRRTGAFNFDSIKKIRAYCGPHGIGKSTTVLAAKKINHRICYLNIKALINNSKNVFIWKYKILFFELLDTLKYFASYEIFDELKKELIKINNIWDSITYIVKFMINKKLKINFIIDQFQEKVDYHYTNIKEIIQLIQNDSLNNVTLLILSSINDKDVRASLIQTWCNIKLEKEILFTYIYIFNLIDITRIIKGDKL